MRKAVSLGPLRRQSGLSLVVALIMLVVMTATTLMVFRMSNTGSQIVGNMQFRNEALAVADGVVQEVISSTRLFESPDALFTENNCDGGGNFNQRCYDVNGDNSNDLQVDVEAPACTQVTIIPNASLNFAVQSELDCAVGEGAERGIEGAAQGNSLCARTVWEVRADAKDAGSSGATGARVRLVQGIGVQVRRGVALTFCFGATGP